MGAESANRRRLVVMRPVFAGGEDFAKAAQPWKNVTLRQPGHVKNDARAPCLDTAMVGIDCFGGAGGRDRRIVHEHDGVVIHGEAIGFEGQDIVGFLIEDRLGGCDLTMHGVGRHRAALDVEKIKKSAQCRNLSRSGGKTDKAKRQAAR